VTLAALRRRLLEAREARARQLASLAGSDPEMTPIVVSTNVPGPDKSPPGLDAVFAGARAALLEALPGSRVAAEGRDALGPWAILACREAPASAKARCVGIEASLPAGRLMDLDVYDGEGRQVDRRALGLPPRRCLVCDEPAVDCIRLARHAPSDLNAAIARLLARTT
jgi:holo-ACP synthase CitX